MSQSEDDPSRLRVNLVSVDQIEAATGLDFFAVIDDAAEAEFEAVRAERMW